MQSILEGQPDGIDKLCSIILVMTNIAMAVQEQVDIKVKAPELMQNLLTVQKYANPASNPIQFVTEQSTYVMIGFITRVFCKSRYLEDSPKLLQFLTEANVMCSSLFVLINDCSKEVCSFLTLQLNDAPRFKIHTRYLEGLLSLVSLVINSGTESEVHVSKSSLPSRLCVELAESLRR